MKQVLKWQLTITNAQTLRVPESTTLLSVHEQDDILCVWGLADLSESVHDRIIYVVGTGNITPYAVQEDDARYVGTVVMTGFHQGLVWHVFEQLPA